MKKGVKKRQEEIHFGSILCTFESAPEEEGEG